MDEGSSQCHRTDTSSACETPGDGARGTGFGTASSPEFIQGSHNQQGNSSDSDDRGDGVNAAAERRRARQSPERVFVAPGPGGCPGCPARLGTGCGRAVGPVGEVLYNQWNLKLGGF